jgi:hypothetical protein
VRPSSFASSSSAIHIPGGYVTILYMIGCK